MAGSTHERPLSGVDELLAHFAAGSKAKSALKIGVEHEKLGVLADGRAPGYEVIRQLLEAMAARGWERVEEGGHLIALKRPMCGSITLEPGGQVEHSGAPWPTAVQAVHDNDKHTDQILPLAAELGIRFLGCGFRPFGTIDDVQWMPKGRYRVMRAYLPTRGALAHEMMKRTTTVQANLDYETEDDAMEKLRVAMGLSSLVTSLFAASPLVDGKVSGYQSYRARAWLDTDNDRCGLLPFAFRPDARFRDYTDWALDVPMFFVYRGGEYHPANGMPFRAFLRDGWQGERATMSDWELHLSTLFPEVRLKRYVEVRGADAGPMPMARGLGALWRGILEDPTARAAAWALVSGGTFAEREALRREVPRAGLNARFGGRRLRDLAVELCRIADAGLARLRDGAADRPLLEPLRARAESGRSPADDLLADFQATGGDPRALVDRWELRV
jgi:glutamate--cysteine ligase